MIAAIRPDDLIPHEAGHKPDADSGNCLRVRLREMEFLGSFWRCSLGHQSLGGQMLIGDFSVNAARRLSLEEGGEMMIELPASRLMIFGRDESEDGDD